MNKSTNPRDIDNASTFLSNATSDRSPAEIYTAVAVICIVYVVSLAGNVMICILTLTSRCLRTLNSMLVINLAISDIGIVSTNVPFSIIVLLKDGWIFSARVCDWNAILGMLFSGASVWTMASIAAHRYLQICKTQFYTRYINVGVVVGNTCLIWLMVTSVHIMPWLGIGEYFFSIDLTICDMDWTSDLAFCMSVVIIWALIPYGTIVYSYFRIIRCVLLSRRRVRQRSTRGDPTPLPWYSVTSSDVQMTKMSFFICITFISTWCPVAVAVVAPKFGYDLGQRFPLMAVIFLYIGTAADPFIYSFMKGPYNRELNRLLKRWKTSVGTRDVDVSVNTIEM